ncbi:MULTISPECIES: cupin domain-containing protein [Streptomyces]|uniref:hypothetical protein n=1 Tax=Streptomyces TaxID=1883 RepID=UPI0004C91F96|nr:MULTISPECIES: hypothetical protein [Streptomyces]QHF95259.1 hypothetical protein DEH18_16900 [Streptomyces sp. NHF165]
MSDSDWELFLRDMALCLATYQGRGPAMVWPARAHAVLPGLRGPDDEAAGEGTGDDGWRPVPPGSGAHALAVDLGHAMGYPVVAYQRLLPAGVTLPVEHTGPDILLLPLRGGARCRVERPERAQRHGEGVELRLRAGEMFYVPARHPCTLDDISTPCPMLLLALHATP